jgi:hypothetical protein
MFLIGALLEQPMVFQDRRMAGHRHGAVHRVQTI